MLAKFLTNRTIYQYGLLCILIIIFGTYSVSLGQDVGFDMRNYHFYDGYAFIHHRLGWDIVPASIQTYLNPFFDVFNYLLITISKPRVVAFTEGTISGIAIFFLFKSALLLFSELTPRLQLFYAALATLLGATGTANIQQIGSMSNDTKALLFVMLALYCVLKSVTLIDNKIRRNYIIISGLLMGLVTGFKLTTACYTTGLFVALICYKYPTRETLKHASLYVVTVIAGFIIANGYWMHTLYQHFGNPLFPYYNNIFHSPYAEFGNFEDMRYHPQTLFQYTFLPFYLVNNLLPQLSVHDPRFAVVFGLGIIFIFICLYKQQTIKPKERLLLIMFFTTYLAWLIKFTIYRYAIGLEAISGLLIVYFIKTIITKQPLQALTATVATILVMINTIEIPGFFVYTQFGNKYFTLNVPPLPQTPLILVVSDSPASYVIPFFPSDTRFVSLYNSFTKDDKPNLTKATIQKIIANYQGPIFGITEKHDKKDLLKNVLNSYHLVPTQKQGQTIKTNTIDEFYLYPVAKT